MPIFRLRPIDGSHPEWMAAPIRGPVQVIADDEAQARHAAAEQLYVVERLDAEHARLPNPWMRVDRVVVEPVTEIDENQPLLEGYRPHGKRGRPSARSLILLTPMNLDAPEWSLSFSTDPVCVEARHAPHARAIAALYFDVTMGQQENGCGALIHPWWSPRLVAAEEVAKVPAGVKLIRARDHRPQMFMRPKG